MTGAIVPYVFRAELTRVIDGDTVELLVDVGFYIWVRMKFRLARINAPELGTPGGQEAKLYVEAMFASTKKCVVETSKTEKFGRWLAEVIVGGKNVGSALLDNGMATLYGAPK